MVVTSRCFAFRALITQARIWKSFWVENVTSSLYPPIPSSAETWNIFTNMLCKFCFRLSWHFNQENAVFWKAFFFFRKTRTTGRPSELMSRATCDPIHLLHFVTPALGLTQVIGRNIKHIIWHLLIPNVDIMYEKWIKITYRMFLVSYFTLNSAAGRSWTPSEFCPFSPTSKRPSQLRLWKIKAR